MLKAQLVKCSCSHFGVVFLQNGQLFLHGLHLALELQPIHLRVIDDLLQTHEVLLHRAARLVLHLQPAGGARAVDHLCLIVHTKKHITDSDVNGHAHKHFGPFSRVLGGRETAIEVMSKTLFKIDYLIVV